MKNIFPLIVIYIFSLIQIGCRAENHGYELKTDGYYFSNDHLKNTSDNSVDLKYYAIILYEDSTLSDFYNLSSSKEEFESILENQSYERIKEFSKYGAYSIYGDSIFITIKTQRFSSQLENYKPKIEGKMKGVILSNVEFKIVETEIEGEKRILNHTFSFVEHEKLKTKGDKTKFK